MTEEQPPTSGLQRATPPATLRKFLRVTAAVCLVSFSLLLMIFVTNQNKIADRDSITYWACGRLLLAHQNPYDAAALLQLDRAAGSVGDRVAIVRYPPYGLAFTLPLGVLSARTSGLVWSIAICGALFLSIRLLWILHGRQPDRTHLLAYVFPPAMCCLLAGQIGIFLLLSCCCFFVLQKERPFLAGMCLTVASVKPHLFVLPAFALLFWCYSGRRWRILQGFVAAWIPALLLPLLFDHSVYSDYQRGLSADRVGNEFIPTISTLVRIALARQNIALQFVPLLLGVGWTWWYCRRKSSAWEWPREGALVIAIGVLVAPYAWTTDEVLCLPAVLSALYALPRTRRSIAPYALMNGVGLLEVLFAVPMPSGAYLWTAPGWVAWVAYASRAKDGDSAPGGAMIADVPAE